jgi:hypothetical protein
MGDTATESVELGANAARYAEVSADERAATVGQLAALLAATHAELLDVIAAVDACGDWEADGASGSVPWLVGQVGIARRTATEWVRVATALMALPALRDAYAQGMLSWDQVRPATRFVTPADDAQHAAMLPGYSAAQIELMARQRRPISIAEANDAHANRGFSWRRDHRRGGYAYRGFLSFDQGEAINVALDRHAESAGPDPATGAWAPIATRRADALHDLATRRLGADPAPDRATVVIHADAAVVDGDQPGNGFLGEIAICQGSVLRALCDARVEVALHGAAGATVGVARASQQIPAWLRRQIHWRDGSCRFPGCERQIRQIHHITHWATGGETNADNLVGLCWLHHHLVHEGGWNILGDPEHEIAFIRPDGRHLYSSPQPLLGHVRRRIATTTRTHFGRTSASDPAPRRGPPAT